MIDLLTPRGFVFLEATVAVVMFGGLIGHFWFRMHWPWRLLSAGASGLLVYILIGQVKAYNLQVPADEVTAIAAVFYIVLIAGMLAIRHRERSTHGGN